MRSDLMNLDDAALTDLTNKGSVRRARKSLDRETFSFTTNPDESVTVRASDNVECILLHGRPLSDWPCSCTAHARCWHLPRAVFAYQAHHASSTSSKATPTTGSFDHSESTPASALPPASSPSHTATPSGSGQAGLPPFHPKYLTEEDLKDAIPAGQLRKASRLLNKGVVCHLGTTNGFTAVTLYCPEIASVRFLARHDLNHARCTCPLQSHCAHVAAAVQACWTKPIPRTSLHESEGARWHPSQDMLSVIEETLRDLLTVGLESATSIKPRITRVIRQCEDNNLPAFSELFQDIIDELARYDARSDSFSAQLLVEVSSETAARIAALQQDAPTPLPPRIVAGVASSRRQQLTGSFIGLGTEFLEADDVCWLHLHLVDTRSSRIVVMRRKIDDMNGMSAAELSSTYIGKSPLHQWGSGQVQVSNSTVSDTGELKSRGLRATVHNRPGLDLVPAPVKAPGVARLRATHLQVPRALNVRLPGTSVGVCSVSSIDRVSVDSATHSVHATLQDCDGATFRLTFTPGHSNKGGARELHETLQRWRTEGSGEFADGNQTQEPAVEVAGRWRWSGALAEVTPFLLVRGAEALQPFIATSDTPFDEMPTTARITSVDAVLHELDEVLSETITAGVDRIASDVRSWRAFSQKAQGAGSTQLATLALRFANDPSTTNLTPLLLFRAFAH